ncbi:MAG: RNA polymerase sigma factor [Planctomycetota bacterium]|jgi:RNA polymerase sigma-70 factor (ECF subfamily)
MAEAFERIYRDYGRSVHAYLARLTGDTWVAEELCQETFLRYLRHRSRIHGRNGTLGAWLFRVATNLARDRLRKRQPESLHHDPPAAEPDGCAAAEARDRDARVRHEVERLPPELREVFLLRAHHEFTYGEVAEALDISERTAKERFRSAREILAHRLGPYLREDVSR